MTKIEKFQAFENEILSNMQECNCGNIAEMHVICEGTYDNQIEHPEDEYYTRYTYKVLRCPACQSTNILEFATHGNSADDSEYYRNFTERGPRLRTYIQKVLYGPPKQRHHIIPDAIKDVLNQADSVLVSSPRAAFILCRAALEEICYEYNIPSTKINKNGKSIFISLNEKLEMLFRNTGLSDELQIIIRGIKDLGNEGAHGANAIFAESVSIEDVEVLLELLDYVLERLYVDKVRAGEAAQQLASLKSKVLGSRDSSSDSKDPTP